MSTNPPANLKQPTVQVTDQVTDQVARVLGAASSACSFAELQAVAGLKDRVHFLKTHLEPLLFTGWFERTIPDKSRSSKQKHRPTEKAKGGSNEAHSSSHTQLPFLS